MIDSDDSSVPEFTRLFATDALPPVTGAWDRADLQRIWLGTQKRAWQMLVVVPAERQISTYDVARLITALGRYHGEAVGLADLREIELNRVDVFLAAAKELVAHGRRIVIATRAITENLSTIPLARAADGVVLCVSLGTTLLASVKDVIEEIGKDRFIGSVLVEAAKGAPAGSLSALPAMSREAQS